MWNQRSKSKRKLLSSQLDKPVENKEDKEAEEQHVAQQFGLAASGQLLDSTDGGAEQPARRVKVRVLQRGTKELKVGIKRKRNRNRHLLQFTTKRLQ